MSPASAEIDQEDFREAFQEVAPSSVISSDIAPALAASGGKRMKADEEAKSR